MSFSIEREKRRVDYFCKKTNRNQVKMFVDYKIYSPSRELLETVSGKDIADWKKKHKLKPRVTTMKNLIALSVLVLFVSCGKKENSNPYLFEVANINKAWNMDEVKGAISFDAIDLTDLNNIQVTNLERNGTFDDCTYSATQSVYNDFYGTFEFTLVAGDNFICSQLVGTQGYKAVNDTKKGYEYIQVANVILK